MIDEDDFFIDDDDAEVAADTRKPWTILLVDDEPEVHTVTKTALKTVVVLNRPMRFISAYTGAEAQKIVELDRSIDLMFLDSVMETESAGIDCAKYIKAVLGRHIPVIVMRTGWAPSEAQLMFGSIYLDDFVFKTAATLPVLVALLNKWLVPLEKRYE